MDEEAAAINLHPGLGQGLDWVTEAMFQTGGLSFKKLRSFVCFSVTITLRKTNNLFLRNWGQRPLRRQRTLKMQDQPQPHREGDIVKVLDSLLPDAVQAVGILKSSWWRPSISAGEGRRRCTQSQSPDSTYSRDDRWSESSCSPLHWTRALNAKKSESEIKSLLTITHDTPLKKFNTRKTSLILHRS